MRHRSKAAIVLAVILTALLLLGVVAPILASSAQAAWYDAWGPGYPDMSMKEPLYQNRYYENEYDADLAADMGSNHGMPVIYDIGMELSKDGNIKLVPGVRYRKELTYCWQAFSDKGTEQTGDDAWVNVGEANESTFRPADFMQNGPQMVRLLLAHRSYGTAVSVPIILTLTDGVGENEGFTGDMSALVEAARARGYTVGGHATEEGMEHIAFDTLK
jgi:hypothetical protein